MTSAAEPSGLHRRKLAWFAYLCALAVWALCVYFHLTEMLAAGTLFTTPIEKQVCIADFAAIYNGALLARECTAHGINIYDPAIQADSLARVIAPVKADLSLSLQYPPWLFALLAPLSLLDLKTAWCLWSLLGLSLFAASLCYLSTSLPDGFQKCFFVIAALASFPAWLTVRLGQTSLFLFSFFAAFWCLLRGRRLFLAGLFAGLLLIKLQYAPLAVLAGLARGRLRFAAGFFVSAAFLLAISLFSVGKDNLLRFPSVLVAGEMAGTAGGLSPAMMQNLRGALVLAGLGDTSEVKFLSLAALAVVAVAVLLAWLKATRRTCSREEFEALAGITTLLALLFSPHTHVQDYVLVALSAVWLSTPAWRTGQANANLLARLWVLFPCTSWLFFFLTALFIFFRLQPYFLLTACILALSASLYRKRRNP